MKKTYKDGWHVVSGWRVYVWMDGIVRGVKKDINGGDVTAYPYRTGWELVRTPGGVERVERGWTRCEGITPEAFRSLCKRGRGCLM